MSNIVTGNDIQTQLMINLSAIPCLSTLLNCPKKAIRHEACRAISNITAGNKVQIQSVIDGNIIPQLIGLLGCAELGIKKEAAWAIANATACGASEQIRYIVAQGCIRPLCDSLAAIDARLIQVALEALDNILAAGKRECSNEYADLIEEAEGLAKIEQLQEHQDTGIYEKAVRIMENYFCGEDDELDNDDGFHYNANTNANVGGGGGGGDAPFTFGTLAAALPQPKRG